MFILEFYTKLKLLWLCKSYSIYNIHTVYGCIKWKLLFVYWRQVILDDFYYQVNGNWPSCLNVFVTLTVHVDVMVNAYGSGTLSNLQLDFYACFNCELILDIKFWTLKSLTRTLFRLFSCFSVFNLIVCGVDCRNLLMRPTFSYLFK